MQCRPPWSFIIWKHWPQLKQAVEVETVSTRRRRSKFNSPALTSRESVTFATRKVDIKTNIAQNVNRKWWKWSVAVMERMDIWKRTAGRVIQTKLHSDTRMPRRKRNFEHQCGCSVGKCWCHQWWSGFWEGLFVELQCKQASNDMQLNNSLKTDKVAKNDEVDLELLVAKMEMLMSFKILYESDICISDTGASSHSTNDATEAKNVWDSGSPRLGHTGEAIKAAKTIDVPGQFVTKDGSLDICAVLTEVNYSPKLNFTLLSLSRLLWNGWIITSRNETCIKIEDQSGNDVVFDIVIPTAFGAIFACRFIWEMELSVEVQMLVQRWISGKDMGCWVMAMKNQCDRWQNNWVGQLPKSHWNPVCTVPSLRQDRKMHLKRASQKRRQSLANKFILIWAKSLSLSQMGWNSRYSIDNGILWSMKLTERSGVTSLIWRVGWFSGLVNFCTKWSPKESLFQLFDWIQLGKISSWKSKHQVLIGHLYNL